MVFAKIIAKKGLVDNNLNKVSAFGFPADRLEAALLGNI